MVDAMKVWQEALEAGNVGAVLCDAEDCIDCLAAAAVIQTALDEARADERRAIVAKLERLEDGLVYPGLLAEIERGDHLPPRR